MTNRRANLVGPAAAPCRSPVGARPLGRPSGPAVRLAPGDLPSGPPPRRGGAGTAESIEINRNQSRRL